MDRPGQQILVVVANIHTHILKAEVEEGSSTTAVAWGSGGSSKHLGKPLVERRNPQVVVSPSFPGGACLLWRGVTSLLETFGRPLISPGEVPGSAGRVRFLPFVLRGAWACSGWPCASIPGSNVPCEPSGVLSALPGGEGVIATLSPSASLGLPGLLVISRNSAYLRSVRGVGRGLTQP